MIELNSISHCIGKSRILNDINLSLTSNQTIALIGPNGAGKSTLLSLMSRLEPIQQGNVSFDGMDISTTKSDEIAKKVSILQQNTRFMSRLTIEDLLMFARYPYHKGRPIKKDKDAVRNMIEYFGLQAIKHKFIDQLSGGQRQMALVAMTFCQDTDYVLLDEPLNNLDMFHARHLMQTLKRAISDWSKTIVVVLHDINYASHYADYIVGMKGGEIAFHGETNQILSKENIERLYNVSVSMLDHDDSKICIHY